MRFSRAELGRIGAVRFLKASLVLGLLMSLLIAAFPPDDGPSIEFAEARSTLQAKLQPEWPVSFNVGEPGVWLLQDGFDFSESDGTWMTGRTGALRFRAPDGASPVSIRLDLIPFVPSGLAFRVMELSSSIDDRTIQLYPGGMSLELALNGRQDQEILLACEDAVSPTSSGEAFDLRRLCVKVVQASLRYE